MDGNLTEKLYEEQLAEYEQALRSHIEHGDGSADRLLKEAEDLLALRTEFPQAFSRHAAIEGLVAELIAREKQAKMFSDLHGSSQNTGCLLGWLFHRKK